MSHGFVLKALKSSPNQSVLSFVPAPRGSGFSATSRKLYSRHCIAVGLYVEPSRRTLPRPPAPPTPAAPPAPASGAPRRRRSPRAPAPGRRLPSGRPGGSTTGAGVGARPSRQWQTQWPISWAIVKRKRRSGGSLRPPAPSARVQHDAALGGQEHPRAVDLPRLLDAQAEQVARDRLHRHRQLGAAEETEVALADGVRARILVLRRHNAPILSGQALPVKSMSSSRMAGWAIWRRAGHVAELARWRRSRLRSSSCSTVPRSMVSCTGSWNGARPRSTTSAPTRRSASRTIDATSSVAPASPCTRRGSGPSRWRAGSAEVGALRRSIFAGRRSSGREAEVVSHITVWAPPEILLRCRGSMRRA